MCEVLRLTGREDLTGVARLFISHAWQYGFLQVCDAVWAFLVREHGSEAAAGEEIIWFDLFSNSQHNTGDKPFEWWTGTFMNAIKTMGSVLMVMSPWDNPVTLKRAWCVFEVYACVSTGSRFEVGMTDEENTRFLKDILDEPERYYKMLGTISSAKAQAFKAEDRDAIFHAIELTVGFAEMDSMVLRTLEAWMERELRKIIAEAGRGIKRVKYVDNMIVRKR